MTTPGHQPVPGEDYCRCGKILPCDDAAPVGALAGREQRRRTTANILARIDRAKHIQEDEAALLRTLVTAEQADADQACEQLANARAALADVLGAVPDLSDDDLIACVRDILAQRDQAGASLTDLRNDLYRERRAHEEHRLAIAKALGKRGGPGTVPQTWDLLIEHVADTHQWAMDGALGRTPAALRAKERAATAEAERDAARRFAEASGTRAYRADAEARRYKDAWRNARQRARRARAHLTGQLTITEQAKAKVRDYENRLTWETTCGEHARLLDSCRAADERAERAEAGRVAADNMLRAVCAVFGGPHKDPVVEARETLERAERTEATLTAVRAVAHGGLELADYVEREELLAALGDPQPATEPECKDVQGCHRVVPCIPGCAVTSRALADAMAAVREQPAEPLLRGIAPQVHVHLDTRGAVYHPWPQEWRAQPTESGKSEYRRNAEREAEQRVTVYGISVNEWDRLWLTVQAIADAAGVKPE
jgi:hypothetical protein